MPDEWFYVADRKKMGPVPFAQLQSLAAAGRLKPADMVLQGGTTKWAAAETVPNLFQAASDYLPPEPTAQEQAETREGFAEMIDEAPSTMKAHSGNLIMTWGFVSLGVAIIQPFLYCCTGFLLAQAESRGVLSLFAQLMHGVVFLAPAASIGIGLPAWTRGSKHLQLMAHQQMDPAGQGSTATGRICGLIGMILGGIEIVVMLIIFIVLGVVSRPQD